MRIRSKELSEIEATQERLRAQIAESDRLLEETDALLHRRAEPPKTPRPSRS